MGALGSALSAQANLSNLKVENPMTQYAQYAQGQAAQAEAAERQQSAATQQQQQQLNAIQIQEAQQAQQSQAAVMKAWQETPNNPQQIIQSAVKYGATPKDIAGLQQNFNTVAQKAADLDTTQLKNNEQHHKAAQGQLMGFLQQPEDQAAQQWPAFMQGQVQQHNVTPQDLQAAGIDPNTYPGHAGVQRLLQTTQTLEAFNKQELDKRDAAAKEMTAQAAMNTSGANVAEKGVETTQKQQALDAGALATAAKQGPQALQTALNALPYGRAKVFEGVTDPTQIQRLGMTPEEQVKADQTAAQQAATQGHNQAMEQLGAGRLGVERSRLQMEQGMTAAPGGAPSPTATAIASGNLDPQTARAMLRKNPGLFNQVLQVDPKFDEANMDSRYNTLKEFNNTSNAKAGGQVLAINTLVHHADLYGQVADAMQNGSFKPGNAAYNAVSGMMGSPAPNNAKLVSSFLAGEAAKIAKGGVPSEGEARDIQSVLGSNGSPQQMAGARDTLLQIAAGRAIPLQETAKEAKIDNVVHVIKPDAAAILQKGGYDPTTLKKQASAPAPSGAQTKYSPSTGKHYVSTDGGKTWAIQ